MRMKLKLYLSLAIICVFAKNALQKLKFALYAENPFARGRELNIRITIEHN